MTAKINVCLSYMIGGAYVFMQRLSQAMPQYTWSFTKTPDPDADICLYMNDHQHYKRAKDLGIKYIIQRKTGIRSLKIPEPPDLSAVICGSRASYDNSKHPNKHLLYNGVDLEHLATIQPKSNVDLLIAESRIGVGQNIDKSIAYAKKHNRHLTILGSGEGVAENTYDKLRRNNPEFNWVGRVSPDEALSYIKGCNEIIIANPSHGVANQILEALCCGKQIINLANCEIPPLEQLDIKVTINKYDELFQSILS